MRVMRRWQWLLIAVIVAILCLGAVGAWYLSRPGEIEAAAEESIVPLRSDRIVRFPSDGSSVVLGPGTYAVGFAFVVGTLNLASFGNDETCSVRPFAAVEPHEGQLENVRLNGRYDGSLFATFKLRAAARLSCTDGAGRRVPLIAVARN
jgi:hypothetical protein